YMAYVRGHPGDFDAWAAGGATGWSYADVLPYFRKSEALAPCDEIAIIDYLVRSASDHKRFRRAIDGARTRYVPALVLAEVDYFLRHERDAMRAFVRDLSSGAFTYAPFPLDHLTRAMDIDRRYDDLELGLVDASIVVLSEEVGVRRIATRDVRHFA